MNKELLLWQIEETEKGIKEADRAEFASDHEVHKVLTKWASKARDNRPKTELTTDSH